MSDQARKTAAETTFEQLWATLQENAQQQKETDRMIKDIAQRQKETDREIKAVNQAIGNLGNRLGSLIEHLVSPDMHRKFNALGYAFTRTNTRVVCKDAHDKTLAEVDVLLENGAYALAVEVKTELTVEDVKAHAERMSVLRAYADRHNDTRQYLGAVAGGIVGKQARDYAHKSGFYVLEQSGDTVRIAEPPEAWQPKAW
ncbi:hypothetical protein [Treponema endosymbiont of Eucomonympha sp.]|uniref:hypothetical protein n=1 Tax=Treponema endosymbiont of Eucomonympha sp. TaxID=1580831 RepID=UPI000785D60E|nr:hypothetical protein [Treponema endosymbiont of Eucomonympha sp.]